MYFKQLFLAWFEIKLDLNAPAFWLNLQFAGSQKGP